MLKVNQTHEKNAELIGSLFLRPTNPSVGMLQHV